MQNNWFKTALASEPISDSTQQATNAVSGVSPLGNQPPNPANTSKPAGNAKPTQNQTEQEQQSKNQQTKREQTHRIALPEIANKVLPMLNSSLYSLTNEIMLRDDLNLPRESARGLAIEIMAAWLAASRQTDVSNLEQVVTNSMRISTLVNRYN